MRLITEDAKLIECISKVNSKDPRDELLELMLEYSSDDIYELETLESSIVDMEKSYLEALDLIKQVSNKLW